MSDKLRIIQTPWGPGATFTGDVSDVRHNHTMTGLAEGFGMAAKSTGEGLEEAAKAASTAEKAAGETSTS